MAFTLKELLALPRCEVCRAIITTNPHVCAPSKAVAEDAYWDELSDCLERHPIGLPGAGFKR